MQVFNNYDSRLQFTHETEINNHINFLDLTLIKQNNRIITNWYQKPTNSNRILNFYSNHTTQQKRNIIYNLIDRATLLSEKKFHRVNIRKVKNQLIENNYPPVFIDKCIKTRLRKIRYSNANRTDKRYDDNIFTLALPNNPRFFNKITGFLKQHYIRTVPLVRHGLQNIIRLGKDSLAKKDIAGTVYKISCKNKHCKVNYVGQSKRPAGIRMGEHASFRDRESVITEHTNSTHKFDFKNITILDKESNYTKRKFSEMLHIVSTENRLNKREDVKNLSLIYKSLFKEFHE